MTLHLLAHNPQTALASYQDVLINIWWEMPTVEGLTALKGVQQPFFLAHPRFANLSIVRIRNPKRLPRDVREFSEKNRRDMLQGCIAEATVIELGGAVIFTLARMTYSAMNLLNRIKFPSELFSSLDKGCEWLAPYATLQASALLSAIQQDPILSRP